MKVLFDIIFRGRTIFAVLTVIFLLLSLKPLKHALEVDNSLEIWFHKDAAELKAYHDFKRYFGSDELMIIVAHSSDGWLNPKSSAALLAMERALGSLPEVKQVYAASNAKALRFNGLGLETEPILGETGKISRARIERLPELKSQLFNRDFTATRILVQFKGHIDMDAIRGSLVEKVKSTATEYWPRENLAFGGVGVIFSGLNALTELEFGRFVFAAYFLMLIVIFILFKSWRVSVLALTSMVLATVFSLALYGFMGNRLNLMTVLIPMVVLLLSTMDVIHLLYAWRRAEGEGKEKLLTAFTEVWKPCLITTLTTMAGFLALLFSPMQILQDFGLFSAIGIALSLVFTYILSALLLPPLKAPKVYQHNARHPENLNFNYLSMAFVPRFRAALIISLTAFFIFGIFRLESDTYTLGYLPKNHEVVSDHEDIIEQWGAYMPLELMVSARNGVKLTQGDALEESLRLHRLLEREGYGNLFGYTSLYLAGSRAYNHPDDSLTIVKSNKIGRQLRRYYPDLLSAYLAEEERLGRITLFGEMRKAGELQSELKNILDEIEKELPGNLIVQPAGYLPLYAQLVPYATSGQMRSLIIAALFIGLILWAYFKRLKYALIALFTNVFPLLGMFGIMGWLDVDIDIATASIGAIGLSFCIDDTIHFTGAWLKYRKAGFDLGDALNKAFIQTGMAIVFSSLVLFIGFGTMVFSDLKTVYLFGGLTCFMVVLALFAQLVIFPWLLEWPEGKRQ